MALQRHRAAAQAAQGRYAARYAGLVFAIGLWSAFTYKFTVQSVGPEEGIGPRVWLFLLLGAVSLPIALWAGALWLGAVKGPDGHGQG